MPQLDQLCTSSSLVTSPNDDSVILLGCNEHRELFFELTSKNGHLEWSKMQQNLKFNHIPQLQLAMLVPDDLVTCEIN